MELRASQRAKFGAVITKHGLNPRDFAWTKNPKPTFSGSKETHELTHGETKDFFRFEMSSGKNGRISIFVTYTPSEDVMKKRVLTVASDWDSVLVYFGQWVKLVQTELEAVDPWAAPAESATFNDEDTRFTPLELKTVDKAIDTSMEELLKVAADNGIQKTLADIQKDIKYLKEQARKKTKSQWLDLFKEVIAAKLLEWGINALAASTILQVLYEAAEPALTLMASQ